MSGPLGMDTAAVRECAAQLDIVAGHIASIASAANAIVGSFAQHWEGGDAELLARAWQHQHRAAVFGLSEHIHAMANTARAEALQQDHASVALSMTTLVGRASSTVAATFTSATVASPADIARVERYAQSVVRSSAKWFPGASAQLKALNEQLGNPPSAVQLEALRRYAALIEIAELNRSTVGDAAKLAVDSLNDASSSSVAAVTSGFAALKTGDVGAAGHPVVDGAVNSVLDGANDSANGYVQKLVLDGLTHRDPSRIVDAYDASSDAYLAQIGKQIPSVTTLHSVQMSTAFTSVDTLSGQLEVQRLHGIAADSSYMVTGNGSFAQNVMAHAPDSIPVAGRIWAGAQSGANAWHAGNEVAVTMGALKVAQYDSSLSLTSAGVALGLDQ